MLVWPTHVFKLLLIKIMPNGVNKNKPSAYCQWHFLVSLVGNSTLEKTYSSRVVAFYLRVPGARARKKGGKKKRGKSLYNNKVSNHQESMTVINNFAYNILKGI